MSAFEVGDYVQVVLQDEVECLDRNGFVVLKATGGWAIDDMRVLSITKIGKPLPTAHGSVVQFVCAGLAHGYLHLGPDGWVDDEGDVFKPDALAPRENYKVLFDAADVAS